MHTVCETHAFQAAAQRAGMTRAEIENAINTLAENPEAGDKISGTGGCRKFRAAGLGKGKSGAFRIITFFTGQNLPVFLVTVFGKGQAVNLSKAERNGLAVLTKVLVSEYQDKVVKVGAIR